jgi:DNA anti-recombination protein RmuC
MSHRATIPVEGAAAPRPRRPAPERSILAPTDAFVAAIQDGFAGLEDRLVELTIALRQANGLDAADEELEQLRQANTQLSSEADAARQQLEQLRAIVAQPQVESAPAVAQAPESGTAPPPTPPDDAPAQ